MRQCPAGYAARQVRGRLEPLRVQPFGRLLASYTVNDLGDSIGVVALAVLVFDRTHDVAPTAGFFLVAKFLPALFATGLIAHLDRLPIRRVLPAIYFVEALAFAALACFASGDRFFLPSVMLLGLIDGTLAITGRALTRGAVAAALGPKDLISEGNALMNLGFAGSSVFGAAIGGALIAAFGISAALLVDAASFLVIAVLIGHERQAAGDRAHGLSALARAHPRGPDVRARTHARAHAADRAGARARAASRSSCRSR